MARKHSQFEKQLLQRERMKKLWQKHFVSGQFYQRKLSDNFIDDHLFMFVEFTKMHCNYGTNHFEVDAVCFLSGEKVVTYPAVYERHPVEIWPKYENK